jgi:hypothetical protein
MYSNNLENKSKKIRYTCLGVLGIAFVVFVGTKAYPFVHGPQINIISLPATLSLTEPLVHLSGTARFTKDLIVNGSPLKIDPSGNFDEQLVLAPGYNLMNIQGRDRFGTVRTKNYTLILTEQPDRSFTLNTDISPQL